ncbi:MAG: response regulator [Actinobacteria bacterium]|nr:response regulator [Actinomycetota bacterium]MCL6087067.1 response regulator [Actinomycetota bacterium]
MNELKRILLVEDDKMDIELTLNAFAENSFANEVAVVNDGKEALDYLYYEGIYKDRPNGNPLFILLDLKLPKISGLEVLEIIKKDEKLKTIPVIVLTSSRENNDLEYCYRQGVNAYVVKPVDFKEFMEAVKLIGGFWAVVNEPPPGCIAKIIRKVTAP